MTTDERMVLMRTEGGPIVGLVIVHCIAALVIACSGQQWNGRDEFVLELLPRRPSRGMGDPRHQRPFKPAWFHVRARHRNCSHSDDIKRRTRLCGHVPQQCILSCRLIGCIALGRISTTQDQLRVQRNGEPSSLDSWQRIGGPKCGPRAISERKPESTT